MHQKPKSPQISNARVLQPQAKAKRPHLSTVWFLKNGVRFPTKPRIIPATSRWSRVFSGKNTRG